MKVTFRVDDVSPHMDWERFERLAGLFKRNGVRPLMGVIPDCRDPELLKLPFAPDGWDKIRALKASGWSVAQHGFQHLYTTDSPGFLGINPYSEFAGLNEAAQIAKIKAGMDILNTLGLKSDIFMAPAHSFDGNTLTALRLLGFRYVTDGYGLFPYNRRGLKFIPCQASAPKNTLVGLMTVCLHPNTMHDKAFEVLGQWMTTHRRRAIDFSEALNVRGTFVFGRLSERGILRYRKYKKLQRISP